MWKAFAVVLLTLTIHGVLLAQTTWKGLRFGMSEAEIRTTYGANLRKEISAKGAVLVDEDLELLGAPLRVRAHVELSLGKVDKLRVIDIVVKSPFANEKNETSASGASLAAVGELMTRLTDKYGNPITEEGHCELTAEMLLSRMSFLCEKMWKSDGQNIKLFWSVFDGRLRDFVVSYKPIPTDL